MNNSELDKLLKSAPPPDRAPEFWEQLPKRITARLHWQPIRDATLQRGEAATEVAQTSKSAVLRVSKPADRTASLALPIWKSALQQVWKPAPRRSFAPLAWAFGSVALCVVVALAFFALRQPAEKSRGNPMAGASAEKCFREIESLFPNQVAAIMFDEQGPRLVLSEKADVPDSPPLYLKICGPRGCQEVVTFSGQQIRVNGDQWDVLVDGAGHILIAGKQAVWSTASPSREAGSYRIEARLLETSS